MSNKGELAKRLVTELCDLSTIHSSPELLKRLEVLLADFMICVVSANSLNKSGSLLKNDGLIGLATRLASQSAYEDKDDLDWSAINHPGSVVFAASFATAIEFPDYRKNFLVSTLAGMRASASMAHFFGPSHRKHWHITATAGTFGAVSATAAGIGLDPRAAMRAFHLAGTNMGGIGQVSRELQGTPRFNRAAAAALGTAAALGAYEEMPAITNLWEGDRGLIEVFDLAGTLTDGSLIKDGISTVLVRSFPATGFIHAALLGVAEIAREHQSPLINLSVTVNSGVFPILNDPAKERWWNLQLNCAAVWASQDPMQLAPAPAIEPLVTALGGDVPLGCALITGETKKGRFERFVEKAPGLALFDAQERTWREQKWMSMVGQSSQEITELAQQLISKTSNEKTWQRIEQLLRGE
ncbi:MAG: hypothetical protein RIS22_531 [Actinomycetota bacterium]